MSQNNLFAYYVYGITSGTVDWRAMFGLEDQEPVYAIPHENLLAVVSRVPLDSFGPATLPVNIKDTTWLQEQVLAHERVIRAIFSDHTIIPMKFGTIFESQDKVQGMLREHSDEFLLLLAYLEGKEEWGIKIFAERELLRQEIREKDTAIQARRIDIVKKGAGAAYLLQKRLDEEITTRVEQAAADCGQAAYAQLLTGVVEGRLLRLLEPELTGRKEEMILHAAFLVRRERVPLFRQDAERLGNEHAWWQVECTGPWAPYNFLETRAEQQHA